MQPHLCGPRHAGVHSSTLSLLLSSASTRCSCGVVPEGFSPHPLPTGMGWAEGRGEEEEAQLAPALLAGPSVCLLFREQQPWGSAAAGGKARK